MHIISENVLILFTKTYQNCSMLAETTACQTLRVFFRDTVYNQCFCRATAAQRGCIARPVLSCGGWVSVTFVYCVKTAKDAAL